MTNTHLVKQLEELRNWDEILNLKQYPISDLSSPGALELVKKCRLDMKRTGACELPGFVTAKALSLLQQECAVLEKDAVFKAVVGNAYLKPGDQTLPGDHPLNMSEETNVGVVAYDQFPENSLLKRVYEYVPLMKFVGAILELPEIYPYGDPMGALNLSAMNDSDYLRWHFDQTDFVTSLAIQSAESGGNFEYVPMIRTNSSENYADVAKLLKGDLSRVVHLDNIPGTFVLFQGRYSIHRVTPIKGPRPRWIGLFAYDSKPNIQSSPHLREIRYGRQQVLSVRPKY